MKLSLIALAGLGAAAAAGTALAAARPQTHVMTVPLADGSSVRVEYVGDVAPRVTFAPAPVDGWAMGPMPSFAGLDRLIAEMNRQAAEMMRQAQQIARQPGATGVAPYVAALGNSPAAATSYSVTTATNGACTRTTEIVSQGEGKPPRVTSKVSGDCGAAAAPGPAPRPAAAALEHT